MIFNSKIFRITILALVILLPLYSWSQYAPQAGLVGTTAIHKDSSIISMFSNYKLDGKGINLQRGFQNAKDTSLGYATIGSPDSIFLNPNGFMLSLGDGGSITIELPNPIIDGPGPDFVVFENGFPFSSDSFFLELAFVEVSSDGNTFHRFKAFSNTDTLEQIGPFGGLKAHQLHNLAGKYIMPYGVPFDLSELADSLKGVVTHIRIIDVLGSILPEIASRDSRGLLINDPWPTPFPSGGFDLHAIGCVHIAITESIQEMNGMKKFFMFPNPVLNGSDIRIESNWGFNEIQIVNSFGDLVYEERLELEIHYKNMILPLVPGIYYFTLKTDGRQISIQKLIVF